MQSVCFFPMVPPASGRAFPAAHDISLVEHVSEDSESSGLLLISHNFQSLVWGHFVQFGMIIVRISKIGCNYFVSYVMFFLISYRKVLEHIIIP
jgi:hypothetical protein